ncbi:aspartate-semialdehyde dehydrogenase [Haloferax mediterranei ATCC 33500]|uniref:Aspartate-semialdehyde dehydrogenase n=1 Tax=Haloferax mediterranei (strain ATCC 33500 / DSM 1411 / JCM 8866 / NBRC 14739 / NCIMB 2177 / R-4) TaxID=523841 RepID=I3R7G4_HALMT|nr:aspartate-semialdehyde dehydrogenase [Haloferax mediterranei]AFK20174.1 aspartate-semialdehyde dehydrogenase [Haloferax mediterranei ATCC 33500]AHZ23548.1 aspartate-semialdehyde dehydrogenase [Haloferax mediterranei ATCC 33500]ELZ99723.1 aspartate-semialdehyde dehydrogenase [Haloferax mediterranei ATCC 33500]MDX5987073.1 aspartate-semialdehyde dehydrogenase [Haloferax mediterranei ATCC 33500]QCQ76388.1 aspartate-semialdehyde dehydrogenase [Haloferax mediterranei ATCC 33500]
MAVRVGILGATGAVGQRFIQLLEDHPTFELAALTASESSAGKRYDEAAKWRVNTPIPDDVAEMEVGRTDPADVPDDIDLLFSSLPSSVAAEVEPDFLEAGYVVSSNSSNDRMAPDVPLTIPEINPGHLDLIEVQRDERGWDGALVKNPNCSTITMVPTLAALDQFGLDRVHVTTLQAVSGAGYDGVTSMEIIDNAIPHIGGEEEKMESESRKLLGTFDGAEVALHDAEVNASCNRIPTLDGHLESVFADLAEDASPEDVAAAMREYPGVDLPSAPEKLIHVFEDNFRPQPRLDRERGDGMQISAGGIQATDRGVKYNCLAHNTIRGAAGASVLNGELLAEEGWI